MEAQKVRGLIFLVVSVTVVVGLVTIAMLNLPQQKGKKISHYCVMEKLGRASLEGPMGAFAPQGEMLYRAHRSSSLGWMLMRDSAGMLYLCLTCPAFQAMES